MGWDGMRYKACMRAEEEEQGNFMYGAPRIKSVMADFTYRFRGGMARKAPSRTISDIDFHYVGGSAPTLCIDFPNCDRYPDVNSRHEIRPLIMSELLVAWGKPTMPADGLDKPKDNANLITSTHIAQILYGIPKEQSQPPTIAPMGCCMAKDSATSFMM